ncbi:MULTISPECIES: nucleotide exchange factor GrpE [Alkalihalophilus]|jgi:molecular chaperone GrpE|uniref:Protein GrpE n=2 Tax=Alkalihalophilus TaxID=2893060 RepID=D3FXL0_ALKPO|nr:MULTISPECIES: nucleotide exchange factor GrpE [Alkalihalophilus]ADC50721.1 heat shock protein GrpE [Alkalihalophilus pseudofirmus OF4]ERN54702.1 heat shock protein GrpE [Alkalihalophilus marmarensis DSM 21297]MEC2070417.1 nucleotide exchange factor GrpE [Alkalihalophilus marmarensis]WEG17956.1 nucleotide exchange factor GrpE [Alkalihalophilus pseudofirmus]
MTEKDTNTLEDELKAEDTEQEAVDTDQNEASASDETEVVEAEENPLEAQVAELNNRMLRVQADYDNFRRRSREEKEAAAKYRSQALIEGLLPVVDNFERALLVKPESEEAQSLLSGMEMVYRQLKDTLKNEGVEVIETTGQSFDPHLHQAVMQVSEDGFESNQIVEELQKGYKLKDRVLRPSMVKVNA